MKPVILLLLFGLLLAGCAPEGESNEPATIVPAFVESVTAAAPPVVETPTNPPTVAGTVPATSSTGVIYGRTDDGTFFYGAPDAPVTFIDYSDFL